MTRKNASQKALDESAAQAMKAEMDDTMQETDTDQDGLAETADTDPVQDEALRVEDSEGFVKLREENAELKDRLVRALAETENVRRRAEKDRSEAATYGITRFARDMLTVSDNLRRSLDCLPDEVAEDMKSFIEGVELTERELLRTLKTHGVEEIVPDIGSKFDAKEHQAMFEVPTAEHPAGSVVQIVSVGYSIKDRLLRPAMVGVAKATGEDKVDTTV